MAAYSKRHLQNVSRGALLLTTQVECVVYVLVSIHLLSTPFLKMRCTPQVSLGLHHLGKAVGAWRSGMMATAERRRQQEHIEWKRDQELTTTLLESHFNTKLAQSIMQKESRLLARSAPLIFRAMVRHCEFRMRRVVCAMRDKWLRSRSQVAAASHISKWRLRLQNSVLHTLIQRWSSRAGCAVGASKLLRKCSAIWWRMLCFGLKRSLDTWRFNRKEWSKDASRARRAHAAARLLSCIRNHWREGRSIRGVVANWNRNLFSCKLEQEFARNGQHLQEFVLKTCQIALLQRPNSRCWGAVQRWYVNATHAVVVQQLHRLLDKAATDSPEVAIKAIGYSIAVQQSLQERGSGIALLREVMKWRFHLNSFAIPTPTIRPVKLPLESSNIANPVPNVVSSVESERCPAMSNLATLKRWASESHELDEPQKPTIPFTSKSNCQPQPEHAQERIPTPSLAQLRKWADGNVED